MKYGDPGEASPRLNTYTASQRPLVSVWRCMIDRCENPNSNEFFRYGANKITVCMSWKKDFFSFYNDMGDRPSDKYSVERIDNKKGYWCGHCEECVRLGNTANCRWATAREQASNRRVKNKTGFLGVSKNGNRYVSTIRIKGVQTYLGSFDTPEEANAEYRKVRSTLDD